MKAKIGLFGFGAVGQGFYEILNSMNGTAPGHVARICVRDRYKTRPLSPENFIFEPAEILNDPEITHIIEVIDRPEDAFIIVKKALELGKTVISANKAMLARRLPDLLKIQQQHGGKLLYEASACGSIPIFQNLEHYYAHGEISAVEGVFNGSTNYILTRMDKDGLDFDEALGLAQQLGFAESDPSLDIDGHDPASKLVLIAAHAFGQWVEPAQVVTFGIRNIRRADLEFAKANGQKIRLLASARKSATGALQLLVLPTLVGPDSSFYALENEYNGILIQSKFIENQLLTGKGAGSLPTGFAVLSDLAGSVKNGSSRNNRPLQLQRKTPHFFETLRVYCRCPDAGLLRQLPFEKILRKEAGESGFQAEAEIAAANLAPVIVALRQNGGFLAGMASSPAHAQIQSNVSLVSAPV